MRKIVFIVMILTLISKILGFGRELVLSFYFGASDISDAYLISTTIPTFVFSLIAASLAASYIPMFNSIKKEAGNIAAIKFTNSILNLTICISVFLYCITFIFAKELVQLFAPGFSEEAKNITVYFTKISSLSLLVTGAVYIFQSYLQVNGKFYITTLVGLPFNFIITFSIFVSGHYNEYWILPLGFFIASLCQLLILLPTIIVAKFKYTLFSNISLKRLKEISILSLPVFFSASANEINSFVDRSLASKISVGGISSLSYANSIIMFIHGIFVISIVTVIYPTISEKIINKDFTSLNNLIFKIMKINNIVVIPSTIFIIFFNDTIVNLLFNRGSFSNEAALMTSSSLMFYSVGIYGMALREVMMRVYYSYKDTWTPTIIAIVSIVTNICLNILFSSLLGVGGLALATSISNLLWAILLILIAQNKKIKVNLRKITLSIPLMLSTSFAFCFTLSYFYDWILLNSNLKSFLAFVLILFIYITSFITIYMITNVSIFKSNFKN